MRKKFTIDTPKRSIKFLIKKHRRGFIAVSPGIQIFAESESEAHSRYMRFVMDFVLDDEDKGKKSVRRKKRKKKAKKKTARPAQI